MINRMSRNNNLNVTSKMLEVSRLTSQLPHTTPPGSSGDMLFVAQRGGHFLHVAPLTAKQN